MMVWIKWGFSTGYLLVLLLFFFIFLVILYIYYLVSVSAFGICAQYLTLRFFFFFLVKFPNIQRLNGWAAQAKKGAGIERPGPAVVE